VAQQNVGIGLREGSGGGDQENTRDPHEELLPE
jgi:hypothetical protein